MPIYTQCGSRNVEGARFCGNCGAPVSVVAIPSPPVWTGAPSPVFPKPGISRAMWRFIGWGSAIAVGIFILLIIIGNLVPSPPATPAATTAQPAQGNASQTPQATDNEAAKTPEKIEEEKQVDLFLDAVKLAWQGTPTTFNERQNLRIDAGIVMPDDTICLWIHDAHPFPGVKEPNALFYLRGRDLLAVNDVTFDRWTRECINQQGGVDMETELKNAANQLQQESTDQ